MEAKELSRTDPPSFHLSLRIRHPWIDPAELTRALHIEPEHAFRAGEPKRLGSGRVAVNSESYWLGALTPSEWSTNIGFPLQPQSEIAQERLSAASINSFGWAFALSASRLLKAHVALLK
jgi:hypothetical protein